MKMLRPLLLLAGLAGLPGCVVAEVPPPYGYAYRAPPPAYYAPPPPPPPPVYYAPRPYYGPRSYGYRGYRGW